MNAMCMGSLLWENSSEFSPGGWMRVKRVWKHTLSFLRTNRKRGLALKYNTFEMTWALLVTNISGRCGLLLPGLVVSTSLMATKAVRQNGSCAKQT